LAGNSDQQTQLPRAKKNVPGPGLGDCRVEFVPTTAVGNPFLAESVVEMLLVEDDQQMAFLASTGSFAGTPSDDCRLKSKDEICQK
jgi:hypothetical protein